MKRVYGFATVALLSATAHAATPPRIPLSSLITNGASVLGIGQLNLNAIGGVALTANGGRLTGIGTPTSSSDAATKGYVDASVPSLSGYVTSSALTSSLSPYALSSSLSVYAPVSSLSSYALTSALSSYALTSSLASYVTSSALTSTLNGYAQTSALSAYVTNSALSTALGSYVLSSGLTSTLSNYVLQSSLTSALSSTLSSYVLSSDSRLTNARTPTAHASTHAAGGSDAVTITEAQVTSLSADLAARVLSTDSRLSDQRDAKSLNGVSITSAGTPAAGQVLVATSASAATWQAQSGSGGSSGVTTVTGSSGIVCTPTSGAVGCSPTYGTAASTFAQGNDSRIVGALQASNNLSDVASATTALGNLGGVATGDSRLTNARTPTAHASTHASGGSDAVTLAESQITNLTSDLAGKQAAGSYLTSLSGDVTTSGSTATLASVGTAGTYGDATHTAQVTTDAKGRVTGMTPVLITFPTQTSVTGSSGDTAALDTTGATVNVSGAAPPSMGQVLTATSATAATWQSPAGSSTTFATPTGKATTAASAGSATSAIRSDANIPLDTSSAYTWTGQQYLNNLTEIGAAGTAFGGGVGYGFFPVADSTTAFRIFKAGATTTSATAIFVVDTVNNRVGINNSSPAAPLDVYGTANASTSFTAPKFDTASAVALTVGGTASSMTIGKAATTASFLSAVSVAGVVTASTGITQSAGPTSLTGTSGAGTWSSGYTFSGGAASTVKTTSLALTIDAGTTVLVGPATATSVVIGRATMATTFLGGIIAHRAAVADAAYTATTGDSIIGYTSLTATRIVTLPVISGQITTIKDESGAASGTVKIQIQGASGTIDGATSLSIVTAYGSARIYCNGTNFFSY